MGLECSLIEPLAKPLAWTLCPHSDFGASDLFLQSPVAFSGDDFSPTGVG